MSSINSINSISSTHVTTSALNARWFVRTYNSTETIYNKIRSAIYILKQNELHYAFCIVLSNTLIHLYTPIYKLPSNHPYTPVRECFVNTQT